MQKNIKKGLWKGLVIRSQTTCIYNWKIERKSGLTLSKDEINLRVSSAVNMPELHNRIDIYLNKYFSCILAVWFFVLNYEKPKYSSFTVQYLNCLKMG